MMMIIAAVFWALVALVLHAAGWLGALLGAVALVYGVYYGVGLALRALAASLGAVAAFLDRAAGRS